MKNVKCKKLIIDRSKVLEKFGILKDIFLFGSFQFLFFGGLVVRLLVGIGKELKKILEQFKFLVNRLRLFVGAIGVMIIEEIFFFINSIVDENYIQLYYSVNFV